MKTYRLLFDANTKSVLISIHDIAFAETNFGQRKVLKLYWGVRRGFVAVGVTNYRCNFVLGHLVWSISRVLLFLFLLLFDSLLYLGGLCL